MKYSRRTVLGTIGGGLCFTAGCQTPVAQQSGPEINPELSRPNIRSWPQSVDPRPNLSPEDALKEGLEGPSDDSSSLNALQSARFLLSVSHRLNETGDQRFARAARRYAERFVESGTCGPKGGLFFPYRFDFPLHGIEEETMYSPWYSGMAQGIALSAFSRLIHLTDSKYYRDIANRIWLSLTIERPTRSDHPWVSTEDNAGQYWIEEYPIHPPAHTLNGKLFAIFGLLEYWYVTEDEAVKHRIHDAARTVADTLKRFRVPGDISYYCLKHDIQDEGYHRTHIWQLKTLSRMMGVGYFGTMAMKLKDDFY